MCVSFHLNPLHGGRQTWWYRAQKVYSQTGPRLLWYGLTNWQSGICWVFNGPSHLRAAPNHSLHMAILCYLIWQGRVVQTCLTMSKQCKKYYWITTNQKHVFHVTFFVFKPNVFEHCHYISKLTWLKWDWVECRLWVQSGWRGMVHVENGLSCKRKIRNKNIWFEKQCHCGKLQWPQLVWQHVARPRSKPLGRALLCRLCCGAGLGRLLALPR